MNNSGYTLGLNNIVARSPNYCCNVDATMRFLSNTEQHGSANNVIQCVQKVAVLLQKGDVHERQYWSEPV
jgi:hypothetical protein